MTPTLEALEPQVKPEQAACHEVTLVDGTRLDLKRLSEPQLDKLHWEQEVAFARAIKSTEKGTVERAETIALAYETVCTILAEIDLRDGENEFAMGMDQRYTNMVLQRLSRLACNAQPERLDLFEIGFGSGLLLENASRNGYQVGGLEVASQLLDEARERIPRENHSHLILGDFLQSEAVERLTGKCRLIYWNDVFEHIPVDEIEDYLDRIFQMLAPGGELITITPNWHMRPSDVTGDNRPPRTTAIGFHLKEYTLREIVGLLKSAGFKNVATPGFVSTRTIVHRAFSNWTALKIKLEPWLERLPYAVAVQCCRRFGFNCTIATK